MIEQVADGVVRVSLAPLASLNCYVLDDVLVDAGARWSARRILRALRGRDVRAHALTHAHPDHQGSSREICRRLDVPLWCGEADRAVTESGELQLQFRNPEGMIARLQAMLVGGPGHPVDRVLQEGDQLGDFTVLQTPGHTAGHLSFWRPQDRLLVIGDAALSMNPLTTRRGLREPPELFTRHPERNRASLRKLAVLGPETICFGHGPVLHDGAAYQDFVARLPPRAPYEWTEA